MPTWFKIINCSSQWYHGEVEYWNIVGSIKFQRATRIIATDAVGDKGFLLLCWKIYK